MFDIDLIFKDPDMRAAAEELIGKAKTAADQMTVDYRFNLQMAQESGEDAPEWALILTLANAFSVIMSKWQGGPTEPVVLAVLAFREMERGKI